MEKEYFQFYDGEKMGIKTIEDGIIIPAIYDFVECLSDGLFNVTKADSHAYFDTNGKIVLPFQNKYKYYGNFTEDLAPIKINDKWGYIDKSGTEIIKPQFHFAENFSNNIALVRNIEDKYGAIDKRGEIIIDYQFRYLSVFENGYARFGDLRTYGLIDKTGKIVLPQEYVHLGVVKDNKIVVQIKEAEKYKEGIFTIGGTVKWNNNLDKLNEFNNKRKQFTLACDALIKDMYDAGCPCAYERIRNYIQWNKPIDFIDQEVLFSTFSKYLEKNINNTLKCKTCETIYERKYEEYSISMQVVHVRIIEKGNYEEKGASVKSYIPVCLGFRGYKLDQLKKRYFSTDINSVIEYLKEKSKKQSKFWSRLKSIWAH